MKNWIVLTVSFFLCTTALRAQKIAITFYDQTWALTAKKYGHYYRTGIIDTIRYQFHGEVRDYYMNGKLQMKGKFLGGAKVDTFYFYYPSGNLKTKGLYKNNFRIGVWTNYYDNGKVKDRVIFADYFVRAFEYYDEDGNAKMLDGTGYWEALYGNEMIRDNVKLTGSYKDSLRDGTWNYYKHTGIPGNDSANSMRLECVEEYDRGKFIRGTYNWGGGGVEQLARPVMNILPDMEKFKRMEQMVVSRYATIDIYPYLKFLPKADSTLLPVDKQAQFPGGADALTKFLQDNMKFSKSYINSQKQHFFIFIFSTSEQGILEIADSNNKKVLAMMPGEISFYKEGLRALKKSPPWEPAFRNNRPVKNHFSLSILMDNGKLTTSLLSGN